MTLATVLSALYTVSGVAACACYGPQLRLLARDAAARRALSLASWAGWLAVSVVGIAYAAVVADAGEMAAVAAANALCQGAVVALVAGQRLHDRKRKCRAGGDLPGIRPGRRRS